MKWRLKRLAAKKKWLIVGMPDDEKCLYIRSSAKKNLLIRLARFGLVKLCYHLDFNDYSDDFFNYYKTFFTS